MTKVILFDFGGTLDTNGIHWSEKYWDAFHKFNAPFSKMQYEEAYRVSEKLMSSLISPNDGFETILFYQVSGQLAYLKRNGFISHTEANSLVNKVTGSCYKDVQNVIKTNVEIIRHLKLKYKLGVVSNFYGNLEKCLKELGIKKYFSAIIDSRVAGFEKPDPRIFEAAINKLAVLPQEVIVVGDSYERDIQPAKKLGCTTMWLDGKSWTKPADISCADYVIKSLYELIIYSTANENQQYKQI
jgi:putative hydrolase of the HAD superfamily